MTYYDEQLQILQQQVVNKRRKESMLKTLNRQREELSNKVAELKKIKLSEQADVEQLEGRSLAAFFYAVIGKKDEKLDKEKKEAYAASVKYDVASRELLSVEEEIQRSEAELGQLRGCEEQYENALKNKASMIKSMGSKDAVEIFHVEERITHLKNQMTEIKEAVVAGEKAIDIIDNITSSLDSAEGWGTWDLLGGGFLSDMAKHGHLDDAQQQVEQLQVQLRHFKTELTDVTIHADLQVRIEGFLHFADYFFDGLFADWAVLDQINESQNQVQNTENEIKNVLSQLTAMLDSTSKEIQKETAQLNDLIISASI